MTADFSPDIAAPSFLTLNKTSYIGVYVHPVEGGVGPLALTLTGLPAGVQVEWIGSLNRGTNSIGTWDTPGGFVIALTPNQLGSGKATLTMSGGGVTHSYLLPLTIQNMPAAAVPQPANPAPPISCLTDWQNRASVHMKGPFLTDSSEAGFWYYDGARVFWQLTNTFLNVTDNNLSFTNAHIVASFYRDLVVQSQGHLAGYSVFPHGLGMAYQRSQDNSFLQALDLLYKNSEWAAGAGTYIGIDSPTTLRETSYQLNMLLVRRRLGMESARLEEYASHVMGMFDQMFLKQSFSPVVCFQVALGAEALIDYEDLTGDTRVLPLLQAACDWMWTNAWDEVGGGFQYTWPLGSYSPGGQPDLNLLIVPMYGWVFNRTGEEKYRTWGDDMFAQGVAKGYLGDGKHFSQQYRWSAKYLEWRNPQVVLNPLAGDLKVFLADSQALANKIQMCLTNN